MKQGILGLGVVLGMAAMGLVAGDVFAEQGSGKSAGHRNDDFVVICHYDRNQQGPNAGPHTITINRHAAEHHLANHVKKEGFAGDDSEGACAEATAEPSTTATPVEPSATPTEPGQPTLPPTATETPGEPTATPTEPGGEPTATETPAGVPTETPTTDVPTETPTAVPTFTPTEPSGEPTATPTPVLDEATATPEATLVIED